MNSLHSPTVPSPESRFLLRNEIIILGFEFLWGVAIAISNISTMVTGYIEWLKFSQSVVGLAPAMYWAGFSILQPLATYLILVDRHLLRKLVLLYSIASLTFVTMGLAAFSPALPNLWKLLLIVGNLLAAATLIGLADPYYMAIVYQLVPSHRRGRFFGARTLGYGLGGWLGSLLLEEVMSRHSPPQSFGYAFCLTGILLLIATAWFGLYAYRSPLQAVPSRRPPLIAYLRSLARRVMQNRTLLIFLGVDALFFAGVSGGFPLYAGHIRRTLETDEQILAFLTEAYWLAIWLASPVLGWWSDVYGAKSALLVCMGWFIFGSAMVLWPSADPAFYWIAYFLASTWLVGSYAVHFNLAQACAETTLAPAETAAVLSLAAFPVRLISPLLVGWLLDQGHPGIAFGSCIFCATLAILLLLWGIRLPQTVTSPKKTTPSVDAA